jgi:hypothetical protein
MYIRKTTIKSKKSGGAYFSYRLVESERVGQQVKQKTLLNLGKHFAIEPSDWPLLVERIEQITQGNKQQTCLFDMKEPVDQPLETAAQRYAALLINKLSNPAEIAVEALNDTAAEDLQTVDINSLSTCQARSIGGETLALRALEQLGLQEVFIDLGFNKKESVAASSEIIGRMLHPGSERETHRWLQQDSALGECIDYDTSKVSLNHLYRVSDKLWRNKTAIEAHLAQREASLFDLQRTLILYDLTNTYFEGEAKGNSKAQRGRSKEKRSDCPLVTMGLVLDGDGFPVGSEIFAGNASEPMTLQLMFESHA